MPVTPGIRRSLTDIQAEYERGDKAALELLMRAWKGIKELPADDPRSFFILGGYHGEPFRDQGETDPAWWGGYCEHGTVLFPTWHRAYLHAVEQALQSIPDCDEVNLAFWDETSPESLAGGLPGALTWPTFELDGETIPNPLRSFVLPVDIVDAVTGDDSLYSKPAGYETVRYPLSGLVGTDADRAATAAHNAKFLDPAQNVTLLNGNVATWLTGAPIVNGQPTGGFVHQKFVRALSAPSYTVFSNTTSAANYNNTHAALQKVVPLESPHNSIHLSIGGFDVPQQGDFSPIPGANGDMGENDTAGLDPVFYFHHAFIDYTFWTWQQRHGATQEIVIDSTDPGAGYTPGNPPPAGRTQDERLDLQSPLHPFKNSGGAFVTSADVTDIAALGYSYGPGSLDQFAGAPVSAEAAPALVAGLEESPRAVHVEGVDRSKLRGSFVISAFTEIDGALQAIGHEAVLSRWQVSGCANCQSHLKAGAVFPLPAASRAAAEGTADAVHVKITSRHELLETRKTGAFSANALPQLEGIEPPAFTVEVR